jgi:hypothetical protein
MRIIDDIDAHVAGRSTDKILTLEDYAEQHAQLRENHAECIHPLRSFPKHVEVFVRCI